MKLTRLALMIPLTLSARVVPATEFNVNMLNTEDRQHADLSAFSRDGYIAPGNYLLDIGQKRWFSYLRDILPG